MEEITLSNVQITYSGKALTVTCAQHAEESVSLDPEQVEDLVEYIRRLAPKQKLGQAEFNRRESFRVPLVFNHELVTRIVYAGQEYDAKPLDISMAGMQFKLPPKCPLELPMDSKLAVKLMLDEESVKLNGVVRRIFEGRFGVFFPQCMNNGTIAPPPKMRALVMELQRSWMQYNRDINE